MRPPARGISKHNLGSAHQCGSYALAERMGLPDRMELVFDSRHFASALDEFLDDFDISDLAMFKTLTVMKDESVVVGGEDFGVYVGFACVDIRYIL